MPGLDRKLRVGLDWFTGMIFKTDLVQLRVQTSSNITSEHFEGGQVIFEQGDLPDRLYIIQKGEVEVLRDGERIALVHEGESFGEMGLLTNSPRNATIRATKPSDLTAITKGDVSQLLNNFPELRSGLQGIAEKRAPKPLPNAVESVAPPQVD
jgi:CRP-like cAMP-binding protein